jgi:hypothetical protein
MMEGGWRAGDMSLLQNERTKLLAGALSNLGVASVVTGLLGPAAAFLYGSGSTAWTWHWAVIGAVWFFAGVILHISAQAVLGRLKL